MQQIPLKNLNLKDLNPLFCGWENCTTDHGFGPAVRDCYLIHFIRSGSGTLHHLDTDQNHSPTEGCIFLIRPGERTYYHANPADPWHYTWVGLNGEKAEAFLSEAGFTDQKTVIHAPHATRTFHEMVQQMPDGGHRELHVLGKLYQLFSLLANSDAPSSGQKLSELYVRRAEDYIQAQYAAPITIAGLANDLKIDRRYLSRIFTQYTGMSPQHYLVTHRLHKASRLLRSTNLIITEVARSVGYDDAFHFSNLFKRVYGQSPSQFRLSARSSGEASVHEPE